VAFFWFVFVCQGECFAVRAAEDDCGRFDFARRPGFVRALNGVEGIVRIFIGAARARAARRRATIISLRMIIPIDSL